MQPSSRSSDALPSRTKNETTVHRLSEMGHYNLDLPTDIFISQLTKKLTDNFYQNIKVYQNNKVYSTVTR